jgi:hypothetical protein
VSFGREMVGMVGQEMRKKGGLELIKIVNIALVICILSLFSCVPTKVKIYPKETHSEKTSPSQPSSEKAPPEKVATLKPFPGKTYTESISEWKSYQDLVKWMKDDFSFDEERYKKYEGTLPIPRSSEETFQLKSGIYIDAVFFLKENLYRINPSYNPRIVVLVTRPYGFNHYVCSFETGKRLFVMDYGTPYREITGVHGPYSSLEEYKKFYEKYHPIKKKIEAITYLQ